MNYRSTLSTDDTKNTDEEEDQGEGTYPAEEFCPPWHVSLGFGLYDCYLIGDGVDEGAEDEESEDE